MGRRHSEKNKNQDEQRNKTEKANAGGLLKRAHGPMWEDARRVDRVPGVSSGDGPGMEPRAAVEAGEGGMRPGQCGEILYASGP